MTAPLKSCPTNSTPSGDALLASIEASLMSGFEVLSAPPTEFPERHPIAEEFNLPSGINYDALLKDIREFGQKEPIRRHSGKVLDGSDRLRACRELGIPPIYEDYEGDDPLHEFLRLNVVRRHLSAGQYASILLLSMDPGLLARHGGPRGQAATLQHVTVAALANQAGVCPRTQARAVKVFKANPNTLRRVIGGELSLEKAEALEYPKVVKSDPALDVQTDAKDGPPPFAERMVDAMKPLLGSWKMPAEIKALWLEHLAWADREIANLRLINGALRAELRDFRAVEESPPPENNRPYKASEPREFDPIRLGAPSTRSES